MVCLLDAGASGPVRFVVPWPQVGTPHRLSVPLEFSTGPSRSIRLPGERVTDTMRVLLKVEPGTNAGSATLGALTNRHLMLGATVLRTWNDPVGGLATNQTYVGLEYGDARVLQLGVVRSIDDGSVHGMVRGHPALALAAAPLFVLIGILSGRQP